MSGLDTSRAVALANMDDNPESGNVGASVKVVCCYPLNFRVSSGLGVCTNDLVGCSRGKVACQWAMELTVLHGGGSGKWAYVRQATFHVEAVWRRALA